MPVYFCISQHFPDIFNSSLLSLVILINILDEHMLGNLALGDYLRDDWSPTCYDIKGKPIMNVLVPSLMDGNAGLMKAKPSKLV